MDDGQDEPMPLGQEFEHHEVVVNGVRLHYAAAGSGPVMLFVHGFPEFWYTWRHQLRHFRASHRVIAPDMRGYNLSDKPPRIEQYAAPQIVEDLRQLIAHLGAARVVLVAHDWGGAIAWAFAIAHPELVERLVIVNAPHPWVFLREFRQNPAQREASQYMRFFRSAEAEARLSADDFRTLWEFTYAVPHRRGHIGDDDRAAYLAAWRRPGALTGGLNWYRATPLVPPGKGESADGLPDLKPDGFRVRVPTLVIWGMRDSALLPGNLDGLADLVPDLQILRIPEATHWVVEEVPDQVNRAIEGFLGQTT